MRIKDYLGRLHHVVRFIKVLHEIARGIEKPEIQISVN